MTDNNPRTDPVGTVRTREGLTAVKAAMGDDSGKGSHVWLGITDGTVRVYHHADVHSWAVTASPVSSPEGGDSTAGLEVLADACDDFLTAYRGPSDALVPDMLDLIRRALSGEDPYVASPPTGDSTADETPWKPKLGERVTGTSRDSWRDISGKFAGRRHDTARIELDPGATYRYADVDRDSLRPASSARDTAETARYFVELDGHAEPTIWHGTGPEDPNCQPIVRKCTLDAEHPMLWPIVVKALTGQDPADTEGKQG